MKIVYHILVLCFSLLSALSIPFQAFTQAPAVICNASISPSGNLNLCQGSSLTLTASSGVAWSWNTGATSQSITVTAGASYIVTVTAPDGCTAESAPVNVNIVPRPSNQVIVNGATTFCPHDIVIFIAISGASWLWSDGVTTQGNTVSTPGDYTVTITGANGCTAVSTPITVTNLPAPAGIISPADSVFVCPGQSVPFSVSTATTYLWSTGATTPAITATAPGSYTVTTTNANGCSTISRAYMGYYPTPAATITHNGSTTVCAGNSVLLTANNAAAWQWSNGATTSSINATVSGPYTVTITDSNGCTAISQPVQVNIQPLPVVTVNTIGATTFCEGGAAILLASSGASHLWSNGSTTQGVTAAVTGNYSVTITDAFGCSGVSAPVTITAIPAPNAQITPSGLTAVCPGNTATLTATAGASYVWSNGLTTQSIVVGPGSYTVTITGANGCTDISNSSSVVNAPLPGTTISASGPTAFCPGGNVVLTAPAGATYLWSTGAITPNITVTGAGDYQVTVTSSDGCTAASTPISTVVFLQPNATINPAGPTTFCQGGSVTLNAVIASSYAWSTGANTQGITVTQSGTYTVTVTNANGCTSASAPVTVTVLPNPAAFVVPAGPVTICEGSTATLIANAASAYLWSNGATSQSILTASPGIYTVTITNNNNCTTVSPPVMVSQSAPPVANITPGGTLMICLGTPGTLTASPAASYLWSTGATTQNISVSEPGSYSVIVTNNAGCTASSTPTLVSAISPQNGQDIIVYKDTLISPYQAPIYWYLVGNPVAIDSGFIHHCTQNGIYYATGTDQNGCIATSDTVSMSCGISTTQSVVLQYTLRLFPNPASSVTNLEVTNIPDGNYKIELVNTLGQILRSTTTEAVSGQIQEVIQLDKLPNGRVTVRISNGNRVILGFLQVL